MAVKKATKVRRHPKKVVKATRKSDLVPKPKKKKKPTPLGHLIYHSVIETLEHNALGEGEYDLPSILTRVLDQSDPRYKLGLHREYYIPITGIAQFYRVGHSRLRTLLSNQAGMVMPAFGEGIKVQKIDDPNLPLCKECE